MCGSIGLSRISRGSSFILSYFLSVLSVLLMSWLATMILVSGQISAISCSLVAGCSMKLYRKVIWGILLISMLYLWRLVLPCQ